jgi:hypothetical protein
MKRMPELSDYAELSDRFQAGRLEAKGFGHVDHIGVACHMLQSYEFLDAACRYGKALRGLAARAGVPEKFNTTITLAFLGILSERMAETPHETFDEFLAKNPALGSRALMGTWYSHARLASPGARKGFLLPDRYRDRSNLDG